MNNIASMLEAIKAQTDKLGGELIYADKISANWQSGTATSGETGADLVLLGEPGKKKKVHSLIIDIGDLTPGASITIKLFMKIFGVERKFYGTAFMVGTDLDGCWVINGTLGISDVLRVEVESDDASDNGKPIAYTALIEDT
jgi:hypothetical protein